MQDACLVSGWQPRSCVRLARCPGALGHKLRPYHSVFRFHCDSIHQFPPSGEHITVADPTSSWLVALGLPRIASASWPDSLGLLFQKIIEWSMLTACRAGNLLFKAKCCRARLTCWCCKPLCWGRLTGTRLRMRSSMARAIFFRSSTDHFIRRCTVWKIAGGLPRSGALRKTIARPSTIG
jgi:hypothetical protein